MGTEKTTITFVMLNFLFPVLYHQVYQRLDIFYLFLFIFYQRLVTTGLKVVLLLLTPCRTLVRIYLVQLLCQLFAQNYNYFSNCYNNVSKKSQLILPVLQNMVIALVSYIFLFEINLISKQIFQCRKYMATFVVTRHTELCFQILCFRERPQKYVF